MSTSLLPGPGRRLVAALWGALAAPFVVLAVWVPLARALGFFGSVSVVALVVLSMIAGALVGACVPRLSLMLPKDLDGWLDPSNRKLAGLWSFGGLVALVLIGRMAVFLGDPLQTGDSFMPSDPFLVRHSCLTAYLHGAILSTDPTANVYDLAYVDESADVNRALPATAAHFAPFTLDAFGYPPSFLLLPRALLLLTRDFPSQRMLFGAASLLLTLLACASMARALGGRAERRIWLLTPVFMVHPLMLVTLQVGNFHLATVSLCLLCWVALERRQPGLAGSLLAVATLAKIFPGLLGVMVLVQRRWRAVGFTVLAAALIGGLSLVVLGSQVWRDFFFYQLPRVQSGEALRFMVATPREVAFNAAPFGIPFKLAALGFEGWGWPEARLFGNLYSVLLLVLAVMAARNQGSPRHRLCVWMAMVVLASLRSPYAAPFVLCGLVLLGLPLVAEVRSRTSLVVFLAIASTFTLQTPPSAPSLDIALSMVRLLVVYVVLVWVVLRKERGAVEAER